MAKSKKGNKNVNRAMSDSFDQDVWNKIIIATCVLVFFLAFYLLAFLITSKNKTTDETKKTETSFNYSNIVIGRSFDINDEDYVVLYYDSSDEDISSKYSSLMSTYKGKDSHFPIYFVDMSNGINKSKASDTSNRSASNIDELSINGPTLIHFSNGSIVEYFEGEAEITSFLS